MSNNNEQENPKVANSGSQMKNKEVIGKFYHTAQDIFHNMGFGETIILQVELSKIVVVGKGPKVGYLIVSKPSSFTQITKNQ